MEAYKAVADIFLYISEAVMLYYYARSIFEQKYSGKVTVSVILAAHIIPYFSYNYCSLTVNIFVFTAAYILLIYFLFENRFFTALFHAVMLTSIMIVCELIALSGISLIFKINLVGYKNDIAQYILGVITSKALYYVFVVIFAKLFAKNKYRSEKNAFWLLLILPLATIVVFTLLIYISYVTEFSEKMTVALVAASVLLLIANIVVFFIYEYSVSNAQKLYELESIEQKKQIEKQYFEILEQNNKDLKIFTHDIKNHLEQISNSTSDEQIKKYIASLYGTVNQYSSVAVSGNKTLDVAIGKYQSLAANKNIKISFDAKTSDLSQMESADLSSVINNLLDNAVEAAEKSRKREISVYIGFKNAFDIIKIQNSCDTPPNEKGGRLLTSKKEKSLHGLGVESVKKTLRKYDGVLDWTYNGNSCIFETTVAIPRK